MENDLDLLKQKENMFLEVYNTNYIFTTRLPKKLLEILSSTDNINKNFKNTRIIYISNKKKEEYPDEELDQLIEEKKIASYVMYDIASIYNIAKSGNEENNLFFIVDTSPIIEIRDIIKIGKVVKKIFYKYKKKNYTFGVDYNSVHYLGDVHTTSKDINDEIAIFIASRIFNTRRETYTYVYDKLCDILDYQFISRNICDFRDGRCIANRNCSYMPETANGCCYSFKRNLGLAHAQKKADFLDKNVPLEQCEHLDTEKGCKVKCLSCKFFVCSYVKETKIYFDILQDVLVRATFNLKQCQVIHINYFKTEEQTINKLLEAKKSILPYSLYMKFHRELIDEYYSLDAPDLVEKQDFEEMHRKANEETLAKAKALEEKEKQEKLKSKK